MKNLHMDEMTVGEQTTQKKVIDDEMRFSALNHLKREVKQVMEEAVMKRFIYEESSAVLALCCAVENCLANGLKRRVFGIFGATSTLALLHNVSNMCPPAASILRMVVQIEQQSFKDQKRLSFDKLNDSPQALLSKQKQPTNLRYLWIRLAIFEKVLSTIIDYIAKHSHKYYEKDALMADPVAASMVSTLLMGPCALEYSKAKTLDHYFSDPPADELLQRHRIHARASSKQTFSPKTPRTTIQVRRTESLGPDDLYKKASISARECVMSLHQNTKSTLLYGKNNVQVFPIGSSKPMKGYLSLHKNAVDSLIVKWMPNELVHTNSDPETDFLETSNFWKHALCLNVFDVVYIHCHNKGSNGGNIVFVGTDGVQHPPIHLPPGQHPLSFMSCLENGLLPDGQLDPPLWLQKGKGKIFPKLRRRSSATSMNGNANEFDNMDDNSDYVFRIVPVNRPPTDDESEKANGLLFSFSTLNNFSSRFKERLRSLSSSPGSTPPATPLTTGSRNSPQCSPPSTPEHFYEVGKKENPILISQVSAPAAVDLASFENIFSPTRISLKSACDSMKFQILSRAFHGWLAHCKNMKTIRTHLIKLVNKRIISADQPTDSTAGLTKEMWDKFRQQNLNESSFEELHRYVFYGGIESSLRSTVWPYLLGLFSWSDNEEVSQGKLLMLRDKYENSLTEWMAVEAIVREKDREAFKQACETRSAGGIKKTTSVTNDSYCATDDDDDERGIVFTPLNNFRKDHVNSSHLRRAVTVNSGESDRPASRNSEYDSIPSDSVVSPCRGLKSEQSTPEGDGGVYSKDLVDLFAMNLHRIEKDVHRCDRNYWYFASKKNLEKLKNIMCTYVWENLDNGYIQGMCDLAAPLLVIFDDEVLTYGCFMIIMNRLLINFPQGNGMDANLVNLRSLLQVMDPELFELMHQNGDYTHFYFCYRWFLLDFKRELVYDDVFYVWEVIWAGLRISTPHFVLFLSLALIETYRDIVIDNNMDFTDIIKFFNEMAERHDARSFVSLARDLVYRLQKAVEKQT